MKKITFLLSFVFTTALSFGQAIDIDCAAGSQNFTYCYGVNDTTTWLFQSNDGSPVRITFNSGNIEGGWDFVRIYDGENNSGTLLFSSPTAFGAFNLSGLQFDSVSDSLYMELDTDGSVSCQTSTTYTEWNFTVLCATCVNPAATFSVESDCLNGPQFYVDVNLTNLGSASSVTLTDNQGSAPQIATATGLFSFGPYANNTNVVMTIANDDDANCILTGPSLTQDQCVLNIIDCAAGSQNFTYCYGVNDTTAWLFQSNDGSPVRITFNSGNIEGGWDFVRIYDGENNSGTLLFSSPTAFGAFNLSGLQFDSVSDSLYMELDTDGSVSCQTSTTYTEWDFTVSCATCVNPSTTFSVESDCANGQQFLVNVNLTDLGSASSIEISDNQGGTPQTASATGVFTFGPYANTTGVVITVTNSDDANCTIVSPTLTQAFCQDFVVDCAVGPQTLDYCYLNGGATNPVIFTFSSNDGTPVKLTFNSGQVENNWDELVIIDSDGSFIVAPTDNFYGAGGNLSGLIYQSTGDTISFYINSDGSNNCQTSGYTPINVTAACATCVNPAATYTVRQDCINGPQFFVDVDLTDLGSATSVTITDNQDSAPQTVSATGVVTFGPYANNTGVVITVANADDANCTLTSSSLTQDQCVLNIVDCEAGPLNFNYCYDSNDTTSWLFQSTDGSPVRLTFNTGNIEGGWDFVRIYDGEDNGGTLIYTSPAAFGAFNLSGLQFSSTGNSLYMELDTDDIISCQSSTTYVEWNFTVNCATCINPSATYAVVDDCDNGDQFLIDVNVTSLGDAESLTISNNYDANTVSVTETGTYQIGPFPFLTDIIVTLSNDQDVNCVINSSAIRLLACPPANDNPCDATIASVNTNDSCDLMTPGTIVAATPSGVPTGSCTGNPNDDVWYQFTALNEVQLISIVNITGGTTNLDHALYQGTCNGLVEMYCSPNTASITPQLVVGNTYYIRVYSFGSVEETSSFNLCIRKGPENTVCETASNFCGSAGGLISQSVIGIPSDGPIACLSSVQNPAWNIIQIGQSGTINIQITQNTQFDANGNPVGTGLDVDYALWGPFESLADACGNLTTGCPLPANCPGIPYNPGFWPYGNIIDCSWSAASVEVATIDNAIAGEIYILLTSNFANQPGTVQIVQTNAGGPGAGSTVADIDVDLGGNQDLCGYEDYELVATSPFADRYEWYEDGFLVEGATGSTLTITQSNIYTVIAYDDNCDAMAMDEVTIRFFLEPVANAVANIVTCDDASGDEIETFDLEIQTATILGTQNPENFAVTYHTSLSDAQLGVGALTSPYANISNPQTIYVRVEDVNAVNSNSGCFATTSFNLVISGPTPNAASVDMELCDDISRDGFESFTLTDNDVNVLDGQDATQFTVSYYASEANANSGTSPLASPYTNTVAGVQTIWARVESNVAYDCYSVVDLDLIVLDVPYATFNTDVVNYEVCPNATVPIHISLIPNGYTEADVTIQWEHDNGIIPNQTGLTLPILTQGIYTATITFNSTQCSYEVSATVIELPTCVIPQGISPNNDGLNDVFDLSSYDVSRLEIFNRNGTLVYSKNNYRDEWYGQTNSGDELPVGTYFYSMIYQGGKERTGWVYINR